MHNKRMYLFIYSMFSVFVVGEPRAETTIPTLYLEKSIPLSIVRRFAHDGYALAFKEKIIAVNDSDIHYFILLRDRGGGCGVADYNVNKLNYKFIDSYGQCKFASPPTVKDLPGGGSQAIIVKLKLQSNGPDHGEAIQTNAYLYVKESSEFCRNNDAGSFANGTRVPNSVIKFGPSICR